MKLCSATAELSVTGVTVVCREEAKFCIGRKQQVRPLARGGLGRDEKNKKEAEINGVTDAVFDVSTCRLLRFLQEFAQRRVKLLYGKSVEGRETVFGPVFAWARVGSDNAVRNVPVAPDDKEVALSVIREDEKILMVRLQTELNRLRIESQDSSRC